MNIHSLNFKWGLQGFRDQLHPLVEAAAGHRGPVILSGDFNTWSGRRMDLLLRMTDAAGSKRVDFPDLAEKRGWPMGNLDHVFHSNGESGLKIVSAEIQGSIRSSDHVPLLVEFTQARDAP